MSTSPRDREIHRTSAAQLGLLTTSQLSAFGLTGRQVTRWLGQGRLIQLRRGVYRMPGVPMQWETAVLAAVLAGQGRVVASGCTAARIWGISDPLDRRSNPQAIHVSGEAVKLRGVHSHEKVVAPAERTTRLHVPVTTVVRTLADLAPGLDAARLGRLTDEALRLRFIGLEQLRRYVEGLSVGSSGRRPKGAGVLSEVLADRLAGYDAGANAWERAMDRRWDEWGLPPAERQYEIWTPGGVYRPDRAIVKERIAVDWNGYEYHGMRTRFDADSDRRADLATVGWWPLDFTSRSSPQRICESVHAVWAQRRAGGAR